MRCPDKLQKALKGKKRLPIIIVEGRAVKRWGCQLQFNYILEEERFVCVRTVRQKKLVPPSAGRK